MTDPTPARVVPELSYQQLIDHELACARHYASLPVPTLASTDTQIWNYELAKIFYQSARRKRMEFEGRW